ncbi:MAG: hypothetical protein JWQ85_4000 [Mucilaginibacter sp.]|nr:hypothetical protein [Mucilaginibacter sp.]
MVGVTVRLPNLIGASIIMVIYTGKKAINISIIHVKQPYGFLAVSALTRTGPRITRPVYLIQSERASKPE